MRRLTLFLTLVTLSATTFSQITWDVERYLNWRYGEGATTGGSVGIDSALFIGSTDEGVTFDFTVNQDGDIVKLKGLTYAWPSSHGAGYLSNNGSGTLTWTTGTTGGNLSGFTENEIAYGDSDGGLTSSAFMKYSESIYSGIGAGIVIHNTNALATFPSASMINLKSDEAYSELILQGDISSGVRYVNSAGNSQWLLYMDASDVFRINNIAEDDPLYINGASMRFSENTASEYGFYWDETGYKIRNNDNPAVFTIDQNGTEYTITNDGSSLEFAAPTIVDNATTGTGSALTIKLSNASATGKIIDLQHNGTTKFQVTYTGSTVINKTSVDGTHAFKVGQNGSGATGNIITMANNGGDVTTFNVLGKIGLYAGSTPAAKDILVGDGSDFEILPGGTAGQALIVNTGGTALTWGAPLQTEIISGNQDVIISSGVTTYLAFHSTSNAVEARRNEPMPIDGTIKKLYVITSGTQDASGSLVITARKNGSSQTLSVTIAARSGTGVYSDTSNSFTVSAGDLVSYQVVNNATATSARIVSVAVVYEHY